MRGEVYEIWEKDDALRFLVSSGYICEVKNGKVSVVKTINKDILNLSSKGKLSVIMTSTPICPEDLCSKIEADKNWRTTKYPAIVRCPRDVADNPDGGLWARYYRIFDRENAENKPHDESRQFYLDNRKQMDEGAELFAPNRYKPEEHESGL